MLKLYYAWFLKMLLTGLVSVAIASETKWTEWSACIDGKRTRTGSVGQLTGVSREITETIGCCEKLGYGDWGKCYEGEKHSHMRTSGVCPRIADFKTMHCSGCSDYKPKPEEVIDLTRVLDGKISPNGEIISQLISENGKTNLYIYLVHSYVKAWKDGLFEEVLYHPNRDIGLKEGLGNKVVSHKLQKWKPRITLKHETLNKTSTNKDINGYELLQLTDYNDLDLTDFNWVNNDLIVITYKSELYSINLSGKITKISSCSYIDITQKNHIYTFEGEANLSVQQLKRETFILPLHHLTNIKGSKIEDEALRFAKEMRSENTKDSYWCPVFFSISDEIPDNILVFGKPSAEIFPKNSTSSKLSFAHLMTIDVRKNTYVSHRIAVPHSIHRSFYSVNATLPSKRELLFKLIPILFTIPLCKNMYGPTSNWDKAYCMSNLNVTVVDIKSSTAQFYDATLFNKSLENMKSYKEDIQKNILPELLNYNLFCEKLSSGYGKKIIEILQTLISEFGNTQGKQEIVTDISSEDDVRKFDQVMLLNKEEESKSDNKINFSLSQSDTALVVKQFKRVYHAAVMNKQSSVEKRAFERVKKVFSTFDWEKLINIIQAEISTGMSFSNFTLNDIVDLHYNPISGVADIAVVNYNEIFSLERETLSIVSSINNKLSAYYKFSKFLSRSRDSTKAIVELIDHNGLRKMALVTYEGVYFLQNAINYSNARPTIVKNLYVYHGTGCVRHNPKPTVVLFGQPNNIMLQMIKEMLLSRDYSILQPFGGSNFIDIMTDATKRFCVYTNSSSAIFIGGEGMNNAATWANRSELLSSIVYVAIGAADVNPKRAVKEKKDYIEISEWANKWVDKIKTKSISSLETKIEYENKAKQRVLKKKYPILAYLSDISESDHSYNGKFLSLRELGQPKAIGASDRFNFHGSGRKEDLQLALSILDKFLGSTLGMAYTPYTGDIFSTSLPWSEQLELESECDIEKLDSLE